MWPNRNERRPDDPASPACGWVAAEGLGAAACGARADASAGVIVFASDRADNNSEIYLATSDGRSVRRLTRSRDANDRAPSETT